MNATVGAPNAGKGVFTGVPSSYQDLFATLVFLLALFLLGDVVCRRIFRIVPPLVGYIVIGTSMGPEGLNWIPHVGAWVILGNLGLVLLIAQAGLEMDLDILKQIGLRGFVSAVVGLILPISIGMLLSWAALGQTGSTVIAIGCCFGPTSAGISINVLGQCNVLKMPIGKFIVAAAIVDDMLALLILSQLQALTVHGNVNLTDVLIPIVSGFSWLVLGSAMALYAVPSIFNKLFAWSTLPPVSRVLDFFRLDRPKADCCISRSDDGDKAAFSLVSFIALLFILLPATDYSKASYLLGAFLSGLSFCQVPGLDERFETEFKRVIKWLMKVFFAATIGFQVPISLFGDPVVIGRGFLLGLALLGKIAVGPITTPKFDGETMRRWRGDHLRDCAVVGFSMAGEAEFSFIVAVFGLTEGLIPPNIYASVVLAILLSTIASPLLLRITLALYPYSSPVLDDGDDDDDDDEADESGESRRPADATNSDEEYETQTLSM